MKINTRTQWLIALTVAGLMSGPLMAEKGWDRHGRSPETRVSKLAKKLDLSEQQQKDMLKLMEEHRTELDAMRKRQEEAFIALLNDEQKKKYAEMKEKRKEERSKPKVRSNGD